ncbi:hypothetical protein RB596_007449 [Gaeumannomyces avenae]
MSPSGSAFLYEPMLTPPEEPLPKRHKTLTCLRCRRRKQKCDEQRPCTNCVRSQETCREVIPRLAVVSSSVLPTSQMQPLASPVDLCALEERVARLEKSQRHGRRHWHHRSGSGSTSTSSSHGEGDMAGRRTGGPHHAQFFSPDAVISLHSTPAAAAGLGFNHWAESPETNGRSYNNHHHHHYQQQQQQQQHMEAYSSPPPSNNSSGLPTNSAPAIGLLATFARSDNSTTQGAVAPGIPPPTPIDRATGRVLFDAYRARVHSRFAFLRLDILQDLALSSSSSQQQQQASWVGFFTHMIYSIGLLLLDNNNYHYHHHHHHQHQHHYRLAVTRHLGAVFAHPDRVLHAQAHLLLAMHALRSPSTERLASVAGAAARYCVTAGLHLEPSGEDEDEEEEEEEKRRDPAIRAQVRRRVFWSAYALDRAVGAALDLPPAVPDAHVTAELYAAVEDDELEGWAVGGGGSGKAAGGGGGGPVSTALRLVRCLRVAGEVLDARLRRRRGTGEEESEWGLLLRVQDVVDRLDSCVGGGGGGEAAAPAWLLSARDATLAMLLGLAPPPPTTDISRKADDNNETPATADSSADDTATPTPGPTSPTEPETSTPPPPAAPTATPPPPPPHPDRVALDACSRFCTDHRRRCSRAGGDGSDDDWLALIVQFKCGVALLHASTTNTTTNSSSPAPAIRACAAALASQAERWPQARCLRDVFAALSGIPLSGSGPTTTTRKRKRVKLEPSPPLAADPATAATAAAAANQGGSSISGTGSSDAREFVRAQLPAVAAIVVHRPTLRMVRELAGRGQQVPARLLEEKEEEEEEGDDAVEMYDALTPAAFFLLEPPITTPARRDSRYDYLDFGEPDDARPWFDDGGPFRVSA